jgi:hypothetical protein
VTNAGTFVLNVGNDCLREQLAARWAALNWSDSDVATCALVGSNSVPCQTIATMTSIL